MVNILGYRDYPTAPWKNGKGVTREIMKVETGEDGFDWRLSLAEVAESGPFSRFDGYERTITLLNGQGFSLNFDDNTSAVLDTLHQPYDFDGGASLQCELLHNMCQDLNLMVRPERIAARWQVIILDPEEPVTFEAAPGITQIIFCLEGGAQINSTDDRPHTLGAWDCALLTADDPEAITVGVAPHSTPKIFHAELEELER